MRNFLLIIAATAFFSQNASAQETDKIEQKIQLLGPFNPSYSGLKIGVRAKKYAGMYWSNGLNAEYFSPKINKGHLSFGLNLGSSALGTAFLSNALPTLETEIFVSKYFRNSKQFRPMLRLNVGNIHVFYNDPEFSKFLPSSAMLTSLEFGYSMHLRKFPKTALNLSLGYNVVAGDGASGIGLVYPIYFQTNFMYSIH